MKYMKHMCMHSHIGGGQRSTSCIISQEAYTGFFEKGSLTKFLKCKPLCPVFYEDAGDQTQVFMLCLKQFTILLGQLHNLPGSLSQIHTHMHIYIHTYMYMYIFFWERVLLCYVGWLGTCYVTHAGLEFMKNSSDSFFQMPRLQV